MTVHQLLPLAACVLNVCLALLALQRDARSPLNRAFASLAGALTVWTFATFVLRRTIDPHTAWTWQCVVHAGVAMIPPLYAHFVASFLAETNDERHRRPRTLVAPYVIGLGFVLLAASGRTIFIRDVEHLAWGWAPVPGPLYPVFVLWFNATVVLAMWRLWRASRRLASHFRQNRARLIVLGTVISLAGSVFDLFVFAIRPLVGADELLYPSGVVVNMVFSLFMGVSIIRYRMFDVAVAVRSFAAYGLMGVVFATLAATVIRVAAQLLAERGHDPLWLIAPGGLLVGFAVSPLGRHAGEIVDRVMFRRRAGCYDTLLELSRAVGTIRTPDEVAAALVEGVAGGVPVTHCTLLTPEAGTRRFTCTRRQAIVGTPTDEATLGLDGALASWLLATGRVLVREGADAADVARIDGAAEDLAGLGAAAVVPLRFATDLVGVLAIGEKLSGEMFSAAELDVLAVLGSQAALALENARLLGENEERLRHAEQANTELDSFVASTWHELRTPLVAIDGLAGLVLGTDGDAVSRSGHGHLERIQTITRRMMKLVMDVLAISRAGRDVPTREPVSVDAVVDDVLDALAEPVAARGVRVVRTPLGQACAIPGEVATVFSTLVDSALKHLGDTPAPTIEIGMRASGDQLEYWVRDNGGGMDPMALETPDARGPGFGLPIVRKIVDTAGGRVSVSAARGVGTTIRFTWPRAEPDGAYRAAATTPVGQATPVPPSPQ